MKLAIGLFYYPIWIFQNNSIHIVSFPEEKKALSGGANEFSLSSHFCAFVVKRRVISLLFSHVSKLCAGLT